MHLTLRMAENLLLVALGLGFVYKGLRPSAQHRSLLMRWRGEPAVPMGVGWRVVIVSLGSFLAVISTLLAFGWAH
jgi:hypothetical protein